MSPDPLERLEDAIDILELRIKYLEETMRHIADLAEENTKGIDGYEMIAELAKTALK